MAHGLLTTRFALYVLTNTYFQPIFNSYNRRAKYSVSIADDYLIPKTVLMPNFHNIYQQEIEKFKDDFIYSKIYEEEFAENV